VEKVSVQWRPKAISHLKKQAEWYAENMGTSAADKFWNGMIAAGDLLCTNPYLGKIEPLLNDSAKSYRSLVQHKDYKIIYSITSNKIVQIVSIWHCSNSIASKSRKI
jgi:plasmid stabilization system protein ParE